jgi:altronate hydrolase
MTKTLLVHPDDDMVVALRDLASGETVVVDGRQITLTTAIPAKHKFSRRHCRAGELLKMYGLVVGKAVRNLQPGDWLNTGNLQHAVAQVGRADTGLGWTAPDVSDWLDATFDGFHRPDGRVGTRNFWIVVPLVFCENRNVQVLRESLLEQLGYARPHRFRSLTRRLIELHESGTPASAIRETVVTASHDGTSADRIFPQVDGVKFLTHDGGCGGLYEDARTLCGLLAGYMNHPNVAGATVLSLGCQKSQIATLEDELAARNPDFCKPLYILEQQREGTGDTFLDKALRYTFSGLMEANRHTREPAPLSQLVLGVECGASDGFSGITANPAIGYCSDLLVALGGSVILSEFPELSGCENELLARCRSPEIADRFLQLMRDYEARTLREGGGFDQNPSPGNVADGLITDAMKSAGAALKGGRSPVVDVLDYPQPVTRTGLNLLCTPGGDVESTTAMAGSGATIQLFSTGLGTPTGNPVSPVLKISSNSELIRRMPDIIDVDAGAIIDGLQSIEDAGRQLLECVLQTASGRYLTRAEQLGQDDFIPWKRGISI